MVDEHAPYSETVEPSSTLIRAASPPDLDSLKSGDMVICPEEWGVDEYVEDAAAKGVHVRTGHYRYEVEKVGTGKNPQGNAGRTVVQPEYTTALRLTTPVNAPAMQRRPEAVAASEAAFAQTWDALSAPLKRNETYEPASRWVAEDWVSYLPYPTLNPAQAQAVERISNPGSVVVVAPTGAGKTMIGMIAALQAIKGEGRKAAWLVPQRSLTAELDRELEVWRRQGLKVVALSGEASADAAVIKDADLWVATTEKFESLSRNTSMKQAIGDIGTLVVDEIHLLGEPGRGPMLETVLARIKRDDSRVRLIGLSATAANSAQVADWLGADLLEIAWRPTRLTQQVLTIPAGDKPSENRWRNAVAARIVKDVTETGGSTLVFCGAKHNVRTSALAIAHTRGVDTASIDPSDIEAVATACGKAGVGLHYSDWPHKQQAERDFRNRETSVLVATSTLAAGVNTPARAVVVRDTSIGPTPMEVSMIQQMFGRAGRAGKEAEGWSYLIAPATEASSWREQLAAGYTIRSSMKNALADHLLGEVVKGSVKTLRDAEAWWVSTFAHHQGNHSNAAVTSAVEFLSKWRFVEVEEADDADQQIEPTRLGSLTSRMMVDVRDAASLIKTLSEVTTPRTADSAESLLVSAVSHNVAALANGPDAPAEQGAAVDRIVAGHGDLSRMKESGGTRRTSGRSRVKGPMVAEAGLLLATGSPQAFSGSGRLVAGVTRSLFNPALYDSPRHFAWLAAVGAHRAVAPWVSVVARDLGLRVAWYRTNPKRGHGRLLWQCEKIAGRNDPHRRVPKLFEQARQTGATAPDNWSSAPSGTGQALKLSLQGTRVTASEGATVLALGKGKSGPEWRRVSLHGGRGTAPSNLVVAFSSAGDCRGSDWMAAYASASR